MCCTGLMACGNASHETTQACYKPCGAEILGLFVLGDFEPPSKPRFPPWKRAPLFTFCRLHQPSVPCHAATKAPTPCCLRARLDATMKRRNFAVWLVRCACGAESSTLGFLSQSARRALRYPILGVGCLTGLPATSASLPISENFSNLWLKCKSLKEVLDHPPATRFSTARCHPVTKAAISS